MSSPTSIESSISLRLLVFIGIVVVVFFARSVYTSFPELGGDALKKWNTAIELSETGNFSTILENGHHSSRWAIVLPTALANKVFGVKLFNYYLTPLVAYALMFTLLLLLAYKSLSAGVLGLFAVLLFYEPMFFRASSQLQPFVFGVTFIIGSLYLTQKFLENNKTGFLIAASLLAFLAYGSKETYLFFYPGLFLLLWIRGSFKQMLVFGLLLLAWLLLETWVFNFISGDLTFGRIELLSKGQHINEMNTRYADTPYIDLVTQRWLKLGLFSQYFAAVCGLFILYLIATRKIFDLDNIPLGFILILTGYALAITFIPLRIDPIVPLQPLKVKYLTPLMPFMIYILVYGVDRLVILFSNIAKRYVFIGLNFCVCLFLAYCIVAESPIKFRERTSFYPYKRAFIWGYDEIYHAFNSGHGICFTNFYERKHSLHFYVYYMRPSLKHSDMAITHIHRDDGGRYKILHLKKYNVDELSGYIDSTYLEKVEDLEHCQYERAGK